MGIFTVYIACILLVFYNEYTVNNLKIKTNERKKKDNPWIVGGGKVIKYHL